MAKTIKFNLICDKHPVRNLDDLCNNFSVEDVLNYYKNNLLQRWLEVRGFNEELDKVRKIKTNDDLRAIKELVKIFDIEIDDQRIAKDTYIYQYEKEQQNKLLVQKETKANIDKIIQLHMLEYQNVIKDIICQKNNMARIKSNIQVIENNYLDLFNLTYRQLFYTLLSGAPMSIYVLLMHEPMRMKYLKNYDCGNHNNSKGTVKSNKINCQGKEDIFSNIFNSNPGQDAINLNKKNNIDEEEKDDDENKIFIEKLKEDQHDFSECINKLILANTLNEILGDNLKTFVGATEHYWKDLESADHKCMILSMENGNYVRSLGEKGQELDYDDVYGNLPILKGLDYKSNSGYDRLYYLEV